MNAGAPCSFGASWRGYATPPSIPRAQVRRWQRGRSPREQQKPYPSRMSERYRCSALILPCRRPKSWRQGPLAINCPAAIGSVRRSRGNCVGRSDIASSIEIKLRERSEVPSVMFRPEDAPLFGFPTATRLPAGSRPRWTAGGVATNDQLTTGHDSIDTLDS